MFQSILVPLDGSAFGEHALPWAVSLAKRSKGTLHLVHVHHPLEVTYAEMQIFDETLDQHLRQREKAYLDETVRKLAPTGVKIAAVTLEGEVPQAIRAHAQKEKVGLIVLTTHARSALGRFWLGSNTDELLRDSPAPLLIVHPKDEPASHDADHVLEHLLVPLDGSTLSEDILKPALQIAETTGAELTLLRVVRPIHPMTLPAEGAGYLAMAQQLVDKIEEAQAALKKEAAEYLDKIAAGLRAKGHKVHTQVALEEHPGVAILHYAKPPIDGIAISTHARRGLARLFLGSIADKVIRGAHVPVLVHRPKE